MQLFNTKTKKEEEFLTLTPGRVKAYICGPTVYDYSHIGHARSYVNFDVLKRYLESTGYDVTHVQNFTDVDDKITIKSRELGVSPAALSDRFIEAFLKDMDALNVKRASAYTRASEYIPKIIDITQKLLDKGYAYRSGDAVYFEVNRVGGFGALIGDLEGAVADKIETDAFKRGPFDFVLWREGKNGEESWESPWGRGRPGWHTECVAMAIDKLGEVIDLHWGGKDLVYPHHESEAAIAKALTGKDFVRYWVHNEFVMLEGAKMSKSTGNTVFISDVLKDYPGESLRTLLLERSYREKVEYSEAAIKEADERYSRIRRAAQTARRDWASSNPSVCVRDYADMFFGALDDDLETGQALAVVENISAEVLRGYTSKDLRGSARIYDAVESILGIKL